MNLRDTLFNWLQMKKVAEARPDDRAAQETLDFFETILKEDHHLERIEVVEADESTYHVRYEAAGEASKHMFDKQLTDRLLEDINSNPKYNQ